MNVIRVLLVEDHPAMRDRLNSLLQQEFEVVGAVDRGDQVLEAAERLQPDAVVLDISLPGRSGIQLLPELRTQLPRATIVILTAHDEPVYRAAAMQRGADAFLSKTAIADLIDVIRSNAEVL